MAAGPEPRPPGRWRIAGAILPLPFMAVVVVPALILVGDGSAWGLAGPARAATIAAGAIAIVIGLGLFGSTVRLFASVGRGTLAPWDPPERLVVRGPYRYLRHPMIFGVALTVCGETLVFGSTGIAIWLACFVAVNAVYLPLAEEPALVGRFGPEYERYMANVRRWLPRLRPWEQ